VLNLRLTGDMWVIEDEDEMLAVRLGDREIVRIGGLPLDVPSFNQLLDRCRHRRPRRRG
jgi:hypothetical protein